MTLPPIYSKSLRSHHSSGDYCHRNPGVSFRSVVGRIIHRIIYLVFAPNSVAFNVPPVSFFSQLKPGESSRFAPSTSRSENCQETAGAVELLATPQKHFKQKSLQNPKTCVSSQNCEYTR